MVEKHISHFTCPLPCPLKHVLYNIWKRARIQRETLSNFKKSGGQLIKTQYCTFYKKLYRKRKIKTQLVRC